MAVDRGSAEEEQPNRVAAGVVGQAACPLDKKNIDQEGLMASSKTDSPYTCWADDPPKKGQPAEPVIPTVAPSYYGQPMALDAYPWIDGPPQKGKLDPVIPTMSPSAWWQQPALDEWPWIEDPPRTNSPTE